MESQSGPGCPGAEMRVGLKKATGNMLLLSGDFPKSC